MNTTENATTVHGDRPTLAMSRGSSLRRFLMCAAILPFVGATLAFAGDGTLTVLSKQITSEFISCRVQYFGSPTSILGRAKVAGEGVNPKIEKDVSHGEIVRFRWYGDFRGKKGGVINLRSPQTGTVLVQVTAD